MLLLVDAGNTRIKWALMESALLGRSALGHWAVFGSVRKEDYCQLADSLKGIDISRVLVSNVAGAAMKEQLEHMILRAAGLKPVPLHWFSSEPELAGIRNGYRNPAQLGSDRFASMIGAHALYPDQALIVATCGTATTVDAITADGRFIGGMILPGLGLMAASLAQNTAQLPQVLPDALRFQRFADNTSDAIVAGCISAQVGAIEAAVAEHAQALGTPVQCVLSGGAAPFIAPQLSVTAACVDNLVLIGLQAVAACQCRSNSFPDA